MNKGETSQTYDVHIHTNMCLQFRLHRYADVFFQEKYFGQVSVGIELFVTFEIAIFTL